MTSLTPFYIKLQSLYKQKAEEDFNKLKQYVMKISKNFSDELLKSFCENSLTLEWINFRDMEIENSNPLPLESYENDVYKWCLAIKGCQIFQSRNNRAPCNKDYKELENIINEEVIKKFFPNILPLEKEIIEEM